MVLEEAVSFNGCYVTRRSRLWTATIPCRLELECLEVRSAGWAAAAIPET